MYSKSLQNKFLILVAVSVHLRFWSRDQNGPGGSVGTVESAQLGEGNTIYGVSVIKPMVQALTLINPFHKRH